MIIDNSKPWVESPTKKPKFGEVIKSIIEIENNNLETKEEITKTLIEVGKEVSDVIDEFSTTVSEITQAHIAKPGPAHGENANTIGLDKIENLPAALLSDIENGVYKRAWLTPKTLNAAINAGLAVDPSLYITSGSMPLSYGVTLGRALFNQRLINADNPILESVIPKGISSFLLSTEESYLLFGDHGGGILTDFSTGGKQAPIGPMLIDIRHDNISAVKTTPCSLNDITVSDAVINQITGLGFGFGDYNGNYFDSNFHPTVTSDSGEEVSDSVKQSSDASLFDKSIVYKPEGNITIRNYDSTKHNFNELTFPTIGNFPLEAATFLSADNVLMYTANCKLVNKNNKWWITFGAVSGDVGTPDWYPENITKGTNKILSKKAVFDIIQTTTESFSGYTGGYAEITQSVAKLPFGVSSNRANLYDSNFSTAARYSTLYIPVNSIINGFDNLSSTDQQKVINRVDQNLLKRITMAWENKLTHTGVLRIPFYLEGSESVPDDVTKAYSYCMWVDFNFKLNVGSEVNTLKFEALNFNANLNPKFDSKLDLIIPAGSKFVKYTGGVTENPGHPKIFGGCFVETGGHVQAYVAGYRQYVCYYKHQIKNVFDWIKLNLYPEITLTKVKDCATYPTNGIYGDNGRIVPLTFDDEGIRYLAYIRNKRGKYQYAVATYPVDFDPLTDGFTNPITFTWLDRSGEKDLPVLVYKDNFTQPGFEVSGMVFSESNDYTGSFNPNFNGTSFSPTQIVKIDPVLQAKLVISGGFKNNYPIFFYFNSTLYWFVADYEGELNNAGYNAVFGAVRVDVIEVSTGKFEIRQLETMKEVTRSAVITLTKLPESYYGRNHESFDDVFIVPNATTANTFDVFVNFPMMMGFYFNFKIARDGLGYYYPTEYSGRKLEMTQLNGYGSVAPHTFFPSQMPPVMTMNKLYSFDVELYKGTEYSKNGIKSFTNYFMGWKNELPLYVVGSNITVNGKSMLVDQTVKLPEIDKQSGAVFITYSDDEAKTFSASFNPLGYTTEPTISNVFAGFWSKVGGYHAFSYHSIRGIDDVKYADFLNALLPVISNAQMATFAMGSTFPVYLGKVRSNPRQYYFVNDLITVEF